MAVLPITTAVIGLLLGAGGLQELFVRDVWYGEREPLLIGAAGALVSALLLLAALPIWRHWAVWPKLASLAGALSIVVHVYGALPPGRTVGLLAMAFGVGIGIALIARVIQSHEPTPRVVRR